MGCSRPFIYFLLRLDCRQTYAQNTVQAPVPHRQFQSVERLLVFHSFLSFFLPFFLHSFSFPLSLSLTSFLIVQGLGSLLLRVLPPQGFLIQAFPIHPPTHTIHRFKIQRPSSLKPFVHSLVLLCPLSSVLRTSLPSFPPTRSLASLICLCINLLIPHKLFY